MEEVSFGNGVLFSGGRARAFRFETLGRDVIGMGIGAGTHWLNMLETISISASAAAIFSAEEGWGRPWPKRKDIFGCVCVCVWFEGLGV